MSTQDDFLDVCASIRAGDTNRLTSVLQKDPDVVTSWLGRIGRTPLRVVTDWPGYFPHAPRVAGLLIDAGAIVDARAPTAAKPLSTGKRAVTTRMSQPFSPTLEPTLRLPTARLAPVG